jgi:hypothetical protein
MSLSTLHAEPSYRRSFLRTDARSGRRTVLIPVLLAALWPIAALGQTDSQRILELEQRLDQSMRVIDALSAKVRELEARLPPAGSESKPPPSAGASSQPSPAASSQPSPATPPVRMADDHDHGASRPAPTESLLSAPGALRGFADVGAGYSDNSNANKGFTVGSLDLYLTPQLGERVRALAELVFEVDENGENSLDLERFQLGYAFNDALMGWMGRFHAPLGYWNTAFHHGRFLQTSLLRPRFIEFEDRNGIVPMHIIGAWGTGMVRTESGRFTYDLFTGNNPSISDGQLNPNIAGTKSPGLSAGFNLGYRPIGLLDGLKFGVHGLSATVRDNLQPPNQTDLRILGAYAGLEGGKWEAISEYYYFHNNNVATGGGPYNSWAAFGFLGYHFGPWIPYTRVERAVIDSADAYFAQLNNGHTYSRQALGLRYDLGANAALTLEVNHTREVPIPSYDEVLFQYSVQF